MGTNANYDGATSAPRTVGASSIALGNHSWASLDNAIAMGNRSHALAKNALAFGFQALSEGQSSVVIGDGATNKREIAGTTAHADQAVALGTIANVNGLGGVALGSTTVTKGTYGTALGIGSYNDTKFGVALGALSSTDNTLTVDQLGYKAFTFSTAEQAKVDATKANMAGISVGGKIVNEQGSSPGQTAVRPDDWKAGEEYIIRRQIHNVAAGTDDTDAVNVAQLKAAGFRLAATKAAGGELGGTITDDTILNGQTLTMDAGKNIKITHSAKTISIATKDDVSFTTATVGDATGGVKLSAAGLSFVDGSGNAVANSPSITKTGINAGNNVISNVASNLPVTRNNTAAAGDPSNATTAQTLPSTGINTSNAATVGDILNAGWNVQTNGAATDFVRAYDTINFANGTGTTITSETDGTTTTFKVNVNAQSLAETAQLPVVYTKADGTRVYKHTDGNFYTDVNDLTTQVAVTDIIASMQNADGTISATTLANVKAGVKDTDAVNVSQLKAAVTALGGGAKINADGTVTGPSYEITKTDGTKYTAATDVGTALANLNAEVIKPLTFAGDVGNFTRTLGTTTKIVGGVTDATNLSDNNIGVVAGTDTLTVKLAKDLKDLSSVTTVGADGAKTVVNANGITITPATTATNTNPVSLTATGLNNGGNFISNVKAGVKDTDAVNVSQLTAATAAAANTVVAGTNISVTPNKNSDGSTTFTVATKDDVTFTKVTVGNVVTDAATNTITGLANTKLGETDFATKGRAATEEQLNATQDNLVTILGGNAANNNGNVTFANIGGTGKDNIHDAIDAVNSAASGTSTTVNNIVNNIFGDTYVDSEGKLTPEGKAALTTYNAYNQSTYEHNNLFSAIKNINEQGIRFFHTNDGVVIPVNDNHNTIDSAAYGAYSSAIGVRAKATGSNSVALGADAQAGAANAVAVGNKTQATGHDSVAVGNQSTASGINAVAIGNSAQATGYNSISIGTGNIVQGNNSGAIGDPSIIDGNNSYSVGNNNSVNAASSNVFVLGNDVQIGTGPGVVQNVAVIEWDPAANGGAGDYVTNNKAVTVYAGDMSGAVALGNATKVTTKSSVALGEGSEAGAANLAAGTPASAYTYLGLNDAGVAAAPTAATAVVSVGKAGAERQIQHVAAGVVSETSTDAINGSQLYHTNRALGNLAQDVSNLARNVHQQNRDLQGGIAGVNAAVGLPQVYLPGKSMVAAGVGTYRGQQAIAVGFSRASDNGKWIMKAQGNANTRGHVGASVGIGYQW